MKTSLCINEKNGSIVKPFLIADYDESSETLVEGSWKFPFIKTDDSVQLDLGEVGIWEWDDTPYTPIFSKQCSRSVAICEIIRTNPEIKIDFEKYNKTTIEKIRTVLSDGIDIGVKKIDSSKDIFLVFYQKKDDVIGTLLRCSDYIIDDQKVKYHPSSNEINFLDIYKLNKKSIVNNRSTLISKIREFCLASSLIDIEERILADNPLILAAHLMDAYQKQMSHRRKTKKGTPKTAGDFIKALFVDATDSFAKNSLYYKLHNYLKKDPELMYALQNRLFDSDPASSFINHFLESNEKFKEKCKEHVKDDAIKEINDLLATKNEELSQIDDKYEEAKTLIESAKELEESFEKDKKRIDTELNKIREEKEKEVSDRISELSKSLDEIKINHESLLKEVQDVEDHKLELEKDCEALQNTINLLSRSSPVLNDFVQSMNCSQKETLSTFSDEIKCSILGLTNAVLQINESGSKSVNQVQAPVVMSNTYCLVRHDVVDDTPIIGQDKIQKNIEKNLVEYGITDADLLSEYIIGSIYSHHNIIASNDEYNVISNSISAVVDSKKADVFISTDDVVCLLKEIDESESNVIVVEGCFGITTYNTFFQLCKYSKKILIFPIDDSELLKLAPSEIWNYASYIDLKDEHLLLDPKLSFSKFKTNFSYKYGNMCFEEEVKNGMITGKQQLSLSSIVGNMSKPNVDSKYIVAQLELMNQKQ